MRLRENAEDQGFTLIEALVALAVTAASLAAIGQLGFSTISAARRAEGRLFLTSAARQAFAEGRLDSAQGRLLRQAYPFDPAGPTPPAWTPQARRLIVQGQGGAFVLDSVKLRPAGAP